MAEVILSIEEVVGYRPPEERYGSEAGFRVRTNEQEILLLIDDDASCCESWGYFLTEDDTAKFIGAELRGVEITDTNRSTHIFTADEWKDDEKYHSLDSGGVMFVDIKTSAGTLQFVAYNEHNGYYGHEARIVSRQLTHSEVL